MTRTTRLLALGAGASALALAAHLGLGVMTRSVVEAALREVPGARHGALAVDTLSGRVTVADLEVRGPDGQSLHVGRVTLPTPYALISPALAAGDVSFDAVDATVGKFSIAIPRIDIVGTTSSRADIAGMFDMQNGKPLAERLAAFSAASVSAPELAIATTMPDHTSRTVYRDVRINAMTAGVIRSLAASGGTIDQNDNKGSVVHGSFGPVTVADADLPLIAQVYFGGGTPGGEMRLAQGLTTVEQMALGVKGNNGNVAVTIGRMAMKGARLRPTDQPLMPLLEQFGGRSGPDLSPEENKKVLAWAAGFFDSFAIDGIEMTGIGIDGPPEAGHGTIARVAYTGAQVGKPNDLRIESFELKAKDGYGRVGSISHTGWSYATMLKALGEAAAQPGDLKDTIDPHRLIPEIGAIAIRDVEQDATKWLESSQLE